MSLPEFRGFASIPRLSRDMVITEKLDGTNAQIHISESGEITAGSRNRWITPEKGKDNAGFARWVADNEEALRVLGPGSHFGEWWGAGIQRGYGLAEKRFSLFNVGVWKSPHNESQNGDTRCYQVPLCHVVPVLKRHTFDTAVVEDVLDELIHHGSFAAPGFMNPEGVVVFHSKSGTLFKKTLDGNDGHKGVAA